MIGWFRQICGPKSHKCADGAVAMVAVYQTASWQCRHVFASAVNGIILLLYVIMGRPGVSFWSVIRRISVAKLKQRRLMIN